MTDPTVSPDGFWRWDGTEWVPNQQTPAGDGLRADVEAAKARMTNKYGGRRELRKLSDHLSPDEKVNHMATGRYGGGTGLLVETDRRLIFVREGRMSSQVEDFPLTKISSVQWSTGMLLGKLTVFLSGNKSDIDQVDKTDGWALAESVRSRISSLVDAPSVPQSAALAAPAAGLDRSPMAMLAMLAVLRDEGVISLEEYAAKKLVVADRL